MLAECICSEPAEAVAEASQEICNAANISFHAVAGLALSDLCQLPNGCIKMQSLNNEKSTVGHTKHRGSQNNNAYRQQKLQSSIFNDFHVTPGAKQCFICRGHRIHGQPESRYTAAGLKTVFIGHWRHWTRDASRVIEVDARRGSAVCVVQLPLRISMNSLLVLLKCRSRRFDRCKRTAYEKYEDRNML